MLEILPSTIEAALAARRVTKTPPINLGGFWFVRSADTGTIRKLRSLGITLVERKVIEQPTVGIRA